MTMFGKTAKTWDASHRVPLTDEVWFDANDANRAITRSAYDMTTGNVTQKWKPEQNAAGTTFAAFTYDARKLFVATEVNEAGHRFDYTYEYGTGTKLQTDGPNARSCTTTCPPSDPIHPVKEQDKIRVDGFGRPIERWDTFSDDGSVYTLHQVETTSYVDAATDGPDLGHEPDPPRRLADQRVERREDRSRRPRPADQEHGVRARQRAERSGHHVPVPQRRHPAVGLGSGPHREQRDAGQLHVHLRQPWPRDLDPATRPRRAREPERRRHRLRRRHANHHRGRRRRRRTDRGHQDDQGQARAPPPGARTNRGDTGHVGDHELHLRPRRHRRDRRRSRERHDGAHPRLRRPPHADRAPWPDLEVRLRQEWQHGRRAGAGLERARDRSALHDHDRLRRPRSTGVEGDRQA